LPSEQCTQVADAVARVCAEEPQIRARLEGAGDTAPLDRLMAAVRDGGEVAERLSALRAALQQAGDALGVSAPARRGEGFRSVRPVGMGDPRPVEVVFLCPGGSCSRRLRPDPAVPPLTPPTCLLHGQPLRWERL
jgi:hypothetical protein